MKRPMDAIKTATWLLIGSLAITLMVTISLSLQTIPESLSVTSMSKKRQVVDRWGRPLSYTFATGFNLSDERPLYRIPPLLQRAFVEAEDRRFFEHHGVDWAARLHASWQNLKALRVVRGASTISEQVVRMLRPRPRSLWSRFLEGIEASRLESKFSKQDILEFYLNQVPFAANRRGVAQAARYFWDRNLETLNEREQLALAVMVRAPERLDLYKDPTRVEQGILSLADHLVSAGAISQEQREALNSQVFVLARGEIPVRADHFVRHLGLNLSKPRDGRITSTLDSGIQQSVQSVLDERIQDLSPKGVSDGAVLVVDNRTAEILAWVNAGGFSSDEGSQIDAIVTPRQPGSTLKPFLYALALRGEFSAATLINDAPLTEPVGAGLHTYRNYSRTHYGEVSLRQALGNSLNIPAIKTIQQVGKHEFLEFLRASGFSSLTKSADFYGEGLALGNGEVTLFELVQGYAALANRGVWRPLKVMLDDESSHAVPRKRALLTPEVSSVISDILADPHARRHEFGLDGLLRIPVETAVKTGTSTDYRDAWAVGYSDAFTVGVWMGNLNRSSMSEVSGARGPALVLRSVFAELHRQRETAPLYRSPTLSRRAVCPITGKLARESCPKVDELFVQGTEPSEPCAHRHIGSSENHLPLKPSKSVQISMPTPGLNFARDPRIPDELEAIPFEVESTAQIQEVRWIVDDKEVGVSKEGSHKYLWSLVPGHHTVKAIVEVDTAPLPIQSETIGFWVR